MIVSPTSNTSQGKIEKKRGTLIKGGGNSREFSRRQSRREFYQNSRPEKSVELQLGMTYDSKCRWKSGTKKVGSLSLMT